MARRLSILTNKTTVGGALNSPIANATMILKSGLVHIRLHLCNQSGVFYFPSHRHQVEGGLRFLVSYPRRHGQLVVKCFAQEHKRTSRIGRDSSVRLANHSATAPHLARRSYLVLFDLHSGGAVRRQPHHLHGVAADGRCLGERRGVHSGPRHLQRLRRLAVQLLHAGQGLRGTPPAGFTKTPVA